MLFSNGDVGGEEKGYKASFKIKALHNFRIFSFAAVLKYTHELRQGGYYLQIN